MRLVEIVFQVWAARRGLVLLAVVLLFANLALVVTLDQLIVPRIAAKEKNFLQRQATVRQLLHNQGDVDRTPEQLFFLAGQDLARFREAIPEYSDFTGLVEELLVLSGRARLNISQITYLPEELPKNGLLRYELSFNVTGSYENVKKFIHSLEQSQRLMSIGQVGLQGAEDDGVNLRMRLETYFRPGGEPS